MLTTDVPSGNDVSIALDARTNRRATPLAQTQLLQPAKADSVAAKHIERGHAQNPRHICIPRTEDTHTT